jgi:hypothetical protein
MTDDYVEDIKKDMERLNWNKHRFYNEPDTWWDEILKDVNIWFQTEMDIFVKTFTSKTKWCRVSKFRTQFPQMVNGIPIFMQWTLNDFGTTLELAVKKLTPEQAKNFKMV